ncbi:hypothetical protein ECTT12B_0521, partial [Escherichia coli TT12B]
MTNARLPDALRLSGL